MHYLALQATSLSLPTMELFYGLAAMSQTLPTLVSFH
jgi:hypothetical protein